MWTCLFSHFVDDVNKQRRNFFFLLHLDMVRRNSTPGGFAYIWQSDWVPIIATETLKERKFTFWASFSLPSRRWILKSLFSRQNCSACLSAVKLWDIIENRACAPIVHGRSKQRTTFQSIYTSTFSSAVSRGLVKPCPKLLGRDKPRLELAVGWISREDVNVNFVPFIRLSYKRPYCRFANQYERNVAHFW